MVKISICDDDREFLSSFAKVLEREFVAAGGARAFYIGPCFDNGRDVLSYLESRPLDALFLDVRMPDISGFEVAREIGKLHPGVLIVFVTAYDESVFEAFDYSPFAFLRKAHADEDLPKIVSRLISKIGKGERVMRFKEPAAEIDVGDILFFESERNYFYAVTKDGGRYKKRGTISSLERELAPLGFVRIHAGYLVNMNYAGGLVDGRFLTLGGYTLPVAQKRLQAFKEALTLRKSV